MTLTMKNLDRLAKEYERRQMNDLRRLLAAAPAVPTHRVSRTNANAARTARLLRNAPRPPSTTVAKRRNGSGNRAPTNLNAKLLAMHRAFQEQKRRRAAENENRRLRLLALAMPSVPRTRISRRR